MNPKILHEDKDLLVIDKPAGLPAVPVPKGDPATLAYWILIRFPDQKKLTRSPEEGGLINRLDNETSGISVAARNDTSYNALQKIWGSDETLKEYDGLVLGETPQKGVIEKWIAHHPKKDKKMRIVDNAAEAKKLKAREAFTQFETVENFFDYSHLKIRITTGVRHQIRCHMAATGHAIAGDKVYRHPKHKERDWLDLKRHFLHLSRVSFRHPTSGKIVDFRSPLPQDLQETLEKIKKIP